MFIRNNHKSLVHELLTKLKIYRILYTKSYMILSYIGREMGRSLLFIYPHAAGSVGAPLYHRPSERDPTDKPGRLASSKETHVWL